MDLDEELNKLERNLRRLKVEYDAYFGGGAPHPPRDTLFRVETAIRRHSLTLSEMNLSQRFKFNQLAQRFTSYRDLWQRRVREMEGGRARSHGPSQPPAKAAPETVRYAFAEDDPAGIDRLFAALERAREAAGEAGRHADPERFAQFVREKARAIKQQHGWAKVEFSVTVEGGKAKLKAAKGSD